jgi:hypothetical protein
MGWCAHPLGYYNLTLDSQQMHNELLDMQQWQGNEQMNMF